MLSVVIRADECCEIGAQDPACVPVGGSGGGCPWGEPCAADGGPSPFDAGVVVTDASFADSGSAPRACNDTGNTCFCDESSGAHDYAILCDNSQCVCSLDGTTIRAFPASQTCASGFSALTTAWDDCGFPP
jgi:hypothetical protein